MAETTPRPRGLSSSSLSKSHTSLRGGVAPTSPRQGPTASPPRTTNNNNRPTSAVNPSSSPNTEAPPVSPRTKPVMQPPTPNATSLSNASFALFPQTLGLSAASATEPRIRRASFGALEASIHDSPSSPKQVPRKPSNSKLSARDSPRHSSLARGASETPHLFYADHRMTFAKLEQGDSYLIPEGVGRMQVGCSWDHITKKLVDVDASALLFSSDGRKIDHVSFGRRTSNDKSVVHTGDEKGHDKAGDDEAIRINFSMVNETVSYIAIVLNVYTTGRTLDDVDNVSCRLLDIDSSSRFVPAFSPHAHSYNVHRVVPAPSEATTHYSHFRRRSSASAYENAGSTELSPVASIHQFAKPSLPPPTFVPPSMAHEATRYTYRHDSRKMTGVVMLIFERITATEKGRHQREKIANMLQKLATVRSEAAAIRRELEAQNGRSAAPPTNVSVIVGGGGTVGSESNSSPLPAPLVIEADTPTQLEDAQHRTSSAATSQSGGQGTQGVDEESDETAFVLPGWRAIAAGIPVAGKTHRHVTAEVSDLIARFSLGRPEDAFLPPEESCALHGFRSRVLASAGDFDAELAKRREMMDLHRSNMTGGGPDLTQVGSLLDDLSFVEQYAKELQRRRLAARGKSQRTLEAGDSQCSTRTPTPDAERIINTQFRYQRGQRSSRPRLVRQAVRLYSVGRGMRNFAKEYYMDSDSSDEDTYLGDLFPNFRSRDAVRYGAKCYNVGCRRDDLYQYYLDHKASYAAAAREAVAREAAAQEAAWASFSFSLEDFDDNDEFEAFSGDSSPENGGGGGYTSGNDMSTNDAGEDAASAGDNDSPIKIVVRKPPKPIMPPKPTYDTVVLAPRQAALAAAKAEEERQEQAKKEAARKKSLSTSRRDSTRPRGANVRTGNRRPSPPRKVSPLRRPRQISIAELSLSEGEDAGPIDTRRQSLDARSLRRSSVAPPALTELPRDEGGRPRFVKTWNYGKQHEFVRPAATQKPRPITEVLSSPEFQHPERRNARSPRLSLFDEEVRAWVSAYLARERERKQVFRRRRQQQQEQEQHNERQGSPSGSPKTTSSPLAADAKRLRLKSLFADLPPLSEEWTDVPMANAALSATTASIVKDDAGQSPLAAAAALSPTETEGTIVPPVTSPSFPDERHGGKTLLIPSESMKLSASMLSPMLASQTPAAQQAAPPTSQVPPAPRPPAPQAPTSPKDPKELTSPRRIPTAPSSVGRGAKAKPAPAPPAPPPPPPPPPPMIFEDPELNRLLEAQRALNEGLSPRSSNDTFATPQTRPAALNGDGNKPSPPKSVLPPRRNVASAPAKRVLPPTAPASTEAGQPLQPSQPRPSATLGTPKGLRGSEPSLPRVSNTNSAEDVNLRSRPFSAAVANRSNPLLAPVRPSSGARRVIKYSSL